jgi:hypothetical protein
MNPSALTLSSSTTFFWPLAPFLSPKRDSDNLHRTPLDIQLQACLADPDGVSEYRFLVNFQDIKYITVEAGVIPLVYSISMRPRDIQKASRL